MLYRVCVCVKDCETCTNGGEQGGRALEFAKEIKSICVYSGKM